jgi:hypothetical protein
MIIITVGVGIFSFILGAAIALSMDNWMHRMLTSYHLTIQDGGVANKEPRRIGFDTEGEIEINDQPTEE